jgi:inosose dehydratase
VANVADRHRQASYREIAIPSEQRFDFGYHVITWDLAGRPLDPAFAVIAEQGFGWFEAGFGDTLGLDYSRRVMTLGPRELPRVASDIDLLGRLAYFGRVQQEHGLRPSSLFCGGEWTDPALWPHELARVEVATRLLSSFGAPVLTCSGGLPEGTDVRSKSDYREFAARLEVIGGYTAEFGIRTVYHPHLDTFIETREQLDRLMDVLDTSLVGLCIDPAHLYVKLSDPVDVFTTYASVINHVHLKDCTGDETTLRGYDRYLAFAPLGTGSIDLRGIVDALLDSGYDGLVTVELDYSETPEEDCRRSASYIRENLGLSLTAPSPAHT